MREKKIPFKIDSFEADIEADFLKWTEDNQEEYLKKIASKIGWIIIIFNKLEWQLNEVLKQYFCDDSEENSAIFFNIISEMNFAKKIDLLKDFYKLYGNGEKKNVFEDTYELKNWDLKVDSLIGKLKNASQTRNKYAHCFWHRIEEDKFVEFKKSIDIKTGLNKVLIKFDEKDLEEDFKNLSELEIELYNIDSAFYDAYFST